MMQLISAAMSLLRRVFGVLQMTKMQRKKFVFCIILRNIQSKPGADGSQATSGQNAQWFLWSNSVISTNERLKTQKSFTGHKETKVDI